MAEDAAAVRVPALGPAEALRTRWPEYLIEGWALGTFMVSAGVFATALEYPGSPLHHAMARAELRRVLIGVAMGLTAIALIYSPWGRRSGAHMNPAVTLAFLRLGKIRGWDAVLFILAQFIGGTLGVLGVAALGICAGVLVAAFISLEAPLSGMSINPARSFASALPAGLWTSFWLYLLAPVLGMQLAAALFRMAHGLRAPGCAKLHHPVDTRCIHCGHDPRASASPGN